MERGSIIDAQIELEEQGQVGRKMASQVMFDRKIVNSLMWEKWDKYWTMIWRVSKLGQGEATKPISTLRGKRLPWV